MVVGSTGQLRKMSHGRKIFNCISKHAKEDFIWDHDHKYRNQLGRVLKVGDRMDSTPNTAWASGAG